MPSEEEKGKMMTELARSFPSLRFKFEDGAAQGLEPWDFLRLVEASRPWSGAEKLIVSFLATVWNSYDAHEYVESFNVVDACKRWDKDNWGAFARWAQNPFFC